MAMTFNTNTLDAGQHAGQQEVTRRMLKGNEVAGTIHDDFTGAFVRMLGEFTGQSSKGR